MTEPTTTPPTTGSETGSDTDAPRRSVSPWALWYAVLGGTLAWIVHLAIGWSAMEITCIAPIEGDLVGQRAGSPGPAALWLVSAAIVLPWLVALTSAAAGLLVRRRQRRLADAGALDELATGRIELLLVVGIVLDLMALLVITGGGIAFYVLEPCG